MLNEKTHKKNYKMVFLLLFVTGISLFVAILIAFDNTKPDYYRLLWLMPTTFSIISFALINFQSVFLKRVSTLLAFGLYFMRMVISPFAMFLGEYSSFGFGNYVENYSDIAIFLMSYEVVIVFSFMVMNLGKLKMEKPLDLPSDYKDKKQKVKLPLLFRVALFSLVSYLFFLIVSNPSLIRSNFVFLIGTPDNWVLQQEYASLDGSGSGTLGILVTLMNTVFWLIQALLPPVLLFKISQKKATFRYKFVLSILLLISVLLVATETRASSVESALSLLIIMSLVYGKRFTKKIPAMIAIIGVVIIVGLFSKSGSGFNFIELSKTLTAYFSGPQNTAIAIGVAQEYSKLNLLMLPVDVIMKIPYLSSYLRPLVGYSSNDYFNTAFFNLYGRNIGQIIPAIGQGYVYFRYLFAPLIPVSAVAIAMAFEKKARHESNIIFKYIFYLATIMMSRATVISNMLSGISYLFNIFLVYFIASLTIKYLSLRKRSNKVDMQGSNYNKRINISNGADNYDL